jgi:hypothetical protein
MRVSLALEVTVTDRLFFVMMLLLGMLMLTSAPSRGRAFSAAAPEPADINRCGCYEESPGVCKCLRKSGCGCPGQCEPLGCEEKRQKDLAHRMDEELRKIQEDKRNRNQPRPDAGGANPG